MSTAIPKFTAGRKQRRQVFILDRIL